MSPMLLGALALAREFAPDIIGYLTGSRQAEAVAERVVESAAIVTGATDAPTAAAALRADAPARARFSRELADYLIDLRRQDGAELRQRNAGQIALNTIAARSGSRFHGGWRPGAGWVCVAGLAYHFIGQPILIWVSAAAQVPPPPVIDADVLVSLLVALLGLGGLRTAERVKGVAKG